MNTQIASIIMAAGRGSRMKGYEGNKTLLPLIPGDTPCQGRRPILRHIIDSLPAGPKAVIVNHCKADVMAATSHLALAYCDQPQLNGTGGAILAAREWIEAQTADRFIVTMGDVPFVRPDTYAALVRQLDTHDMVILGFEPADKKQYGVLEIEAGQVRRITEWKYWKDYPAERRDALTVCNAGIYAATRQALTRYLPILSSRPQVVHKEIDVKLTSIEEFFITDLIEFMVADGRPVGFSVTGSESETMGVDDPEALMMCQVIYKAGFPEGKKHNQGAFIPARSMENPQSDRALD